MEDYEFHRITDEGISLDIYDGQPFNLLVRITTAPPYQGRSEFDGALHRKRVTVWHNDRRNQFVAIVAKAFAEKDVATLWSNGLFLDVDDPEIVSFHVAILVESVEHARSMRELLPDWALIQRSDVISRQPQVCMGVMEISPKREIVTLAAASELDVFAPDVLVVVTAGDWTIRQASILEADPLIIDIADDFDEQAEEDSYRRLIAYHANHWRIEEQPRWLTRKSIEHARQIDGLVVRCQSW